jgi:transcriptional regulator with XRE-family HTH domain
MARYTNKPIHPTLQQLMDMQGWTSLTQVSEQTGINVHTVIGFAVRGCKPSAQTLQRLSDATGVPMGLLFEGFQLKQDIA